MVTSPRNFVIGCHVWICWFHWCTSVSRCALGWRLLHCRVADIQRVTVIQYI